MWVWRIWLRISDRSVIRGHGVPQVCPDAPGRGFPLNWGESLVGSAQWNNAEGKRPRGQGLLAYAYLDEEEQTRQRLIRRSPRGLTRDRGDVTSPIGGRTEGGADAQRKLAAKDQRFGKGPLGQKWARSGKGARKELGRM